MTPIIERVLMRDSFGFIVSLVPDRYVTQFKIYEVVATRMDDTGPMVAMKDSPCGEPTEDLEQGEVLCEGGVKWDGCTNFHFPAQKHCMLHQCSREGLTQIGEILGIVFDKSQAYMKALQGRSE